MKWVCLLTISLMVAVFFSTVQSYPNDLKEMKQEVVAPEEKMGSQAAIDSKQLQIKNNKRRAVEEDNDDSDEDSDESEEGSDENADGAVIETEDAKEKEMEKEKEKGKEGDHDHDHDYDNEEHPEK